jgi:hypothetical protein
MTMTVWLRKRCGLKKDRPVSVMGEVVSRESRPVSSAFRQIRVWNVGGATLGCGFSAQMAFVEINCGPGGIGGKYRLHMGGIVAKVHDSSHAGWFSAGNRPGNQHLKNGKTSAPIVAEWLVG